jgi:hypothetical protein
MFASWRNKCIKIILLLFINFFGDIIVIKTGILTDKGHVKLYLYQEAKYHPDRPIYLTQAG